MRGNNASETVCSGSWGVFLFLLLFYFLGGF